jgi:hypothetical protein
MGPLGDFYLYSNNVNAGLYMGTAYDVRLIREAAAILALKNDTTAQEFRVYGTTTGPQYISLSHNGTDGLVGTVGGGSTVFQTGATTRMTLAGGSGTLTFADTFSIAAGTTVGLKLLTSSTQKLGLYNATPVVQGASIADATGGVVIDAEARTAINALISRMEALGAIATV